MRIDAVDPFSKPHFTVKRRFLDSEVYLYLTRRLYLKKSGIMTVKRNGVILLLTFFMTGILLSGYFLVQPYTTSGGADMILEHNLIREKSGRDLFEPDEDLMLRAQKHSESMAARRKLYHGTVSPGEAENIAAGYNLTVSGAIKKWLGSPGHRRNIFGPYTEIGWGSHKSGSTVYYTVIFR